MFKVLKVAKVFQGTRAHLALQVPKVHHRLDLQGLEVPQDPKDLQGRLDLLAHLDQTVKAWSQV